MQPKFRLYRRSSRANGTYYAHDCATGARESLGTKNRAEAERLLQARNESFSNPTFSRELAKVYLQAQDPNFGNRTWRDVARLIAGGYEGNTKDRFEKFMRSAPLQKLWDRRLVETCSNDFLDVFAHPKAGVSTNVLLRILHNRALDLEWILRRVLSRRAWPKISYRHRQGITRDQHEAVLAVTPNREYRLFFELLWQTGGSQTDIAELDAELNINWTTRRLFYGRQKLKSKGMGFACLAIGETLEAVLRQLPEKGPLFPHLRTLKEGKRSNYFWTRRVKAGLPDGIVLHSYRYGWAERAQTAGMPEREAMAHLGHGSKAVHRAYARSADRVTMPLEWYEAENARKLIDFQADMSRKNQVAA